MNRNPIYQVIDIVKGTTVDGPGFRTSIYFAGCNHRCPGCHNPQSWDMKGGDTYTLSELVKIINEEDFDVTFSGGDPLMHPDEITILAQEIKKSGRNIWLYTGYTIDEIMVDDHLKDCVMQVDTVVEGPFIESLRDPDLLFRGSSNQRIIHIGTEFVP